MTNILGVHFSDFEKLIGKHRLYYYEGETFFDFHFLSDGMIVKTTVPKDIIENKEQFFSSPIFYNSISLTFRIPDNEDSKLSLIEGVRRPLEAPISTIDEEEPDEVKQEDSNIVDNDGRPTG